jgi:cell division inhibitor SepF
MAHAVRKIASFLGLVNEGEYEQYGYAEDYNHSSVATAPAQYQAPAPAQSYAPAPSALVTPVEAPVAADMSRIRTLHPQTYNDARAIGLEFRQGSSVIMNLGDMDDADARRIVDFSAGLAFGMHGTIERIARNVFLLSPANVDLGATARAQLRQEDFYNQS